jgi:cytochrome P450
MLGFDTDNPELVSWSMAVAEIGDQTIGFTEGIESTLARGAAFIDYIEEVIAARRANPKPDLLTELCKAEENGDTLSHEEVVSMVVLLLAAGNITTTHLIDNAVELLLDNPDQWQRLVDNMDLVPSAVEETLRLAAPMQIGGRKASIDTTFGEREISAGTALWFLTMAANRDPRHFADPEKFDIGRNDRSHLSFSMGIHTCLGAALARMEAGIALRALAGRFPNLSAGQSSRVQRRSVATRGFDELPVILN